MKEELRKSILSIQTPEELHEAYELMKRMQTHLRSVAATSFKVGDKVKFVSQKGRGEMAGIITKINPTTIALDCGVKGKWRVTPTMLQKI